MNSNLATAVPSTKILPMRLQKRDEYIIGAIYEFGGVLSKRQLKELFWADKTSRAMEKRLSKLYHNDYINWPNHDQWRREPIVEPVCWLGWRGALRLGAIWGLQVEPFLKVNENKIRKLEIQLRKQGFHWMRVPRWIQLQHDLTIVDFRLLLGKSLRDCPAFRLTEWLHEGVFRSRMDVMEYEVGSQNGTMKKAKKGVCPDAYFILEDEQRKNSGKPFRARFLFELDNATHDNPSFGLEKALPGAVYIGSAAYKQRFGDNSGRWLVVTTAGQRRMENLMHQTEEKTGSRAGLFYFTTFDQAKVCNLVTSDIWIQGGSRKRSSLIS